MEDPRFNLKGFMDSLDQNESSILLEMSKKEDKHEGRDQRRDDKFGNLDLVAFTENQLTAANTAGQVTEGNEIEPITVKDFGINSNEIPLLNLTNSFYCFPQYYHIISFVSVL